MFSKIYGRVIKKQLLHYIENVFSPKISAYQKNCNSQYVLIHFIKKCREYLDKDLVTGAVLTDLLKTFDCVPHDLLIAKLGAYG